ncbi:TetR family transcriptional regulator [Mycolicibacterium phlei]|uniref:TetR/AcrR family transcriptional regulator n=1 Tax=Mycobacteroides chelonae TaxID=1774 RepID=UPI0007B43377|nr:TetR/AcrR family transcriptional regulator [Mycobacteroides chelonae]ANA97141.1 TetR family transcriptional regulator [Mycobacteroides chelonae CCUG 47445]OLT80796.1 hypothetical protein BKG56_00320 [Mycobacteroides chelonae]ORV16823.1 hypothetical protein AWB96_00605 [Mycobacteroides chelonae]VEG15113.1 TetR family transcriptional regulator [Mycolicibacterium phlei]
MTSPAPAAVRLRADAAKNRQKILAAAQRLFASRGLDVSLDDIAREAGVGVGTVYRRFQTKSAVIDAVFETYLQTLAAAARNAIAHPDPWQGFIDYCELACQQLAESRGLRRIFSSEKDSGSQVQCQSTGVDDALMDLYEHLRRTRTLRDEAQPADIFCLLLMVGEVADFTGPADPDAWRRYLHLLLDGLRNPQRPQRPLLIPALTPEQLHQAKVHHG